MSQTQVTVIGAGTMGHGIAQVFAMAGYQVVLNDIKEEFVKNGLDKIHANLQKHFVEKGKLTQQQGDEAFARLKGVADLSAALSGSSIVVEAVPEDIEMKRKVFAEVDKYAAPDCKLASNTSSLSITKIASATKRPQNVAGMHFFNPPPVMKLVELVRGIGTSDETVESLKKVAESLGKVVVVSKDTPGFLTSRIGTPTMNEAILVLQEGTATAQDIDTAIKLGNNYPMGPLELADYVGLDIVLAVMEILHRELGDKYRPAPLLKKMVEAGWLGKKSGRGFYSYTR